MIRINRLLKLHKLFKPAGDDGADTGGTDTAVLDGEDEQGEGLGADAGAGTGDAADGGDAEAEQVVVTIGDEPAAEEEDEATAPTWVRDLRKKNRENVRHIRDLEQRLAATAPTPAAAEVLGPQPTMETCDFDEAKFATETRAWLAKEAKIESQKNAQADADKKSREAWQTKLASHATAAKALKVPDFEDAEEAVKEALSVVQQGVILQGSKGSATLVYALGKNPKKLKELAAISDPVQFAWAAAQLETQLKVTPRKAPPVPERTIRGGAGGNAAVDSQLAKLEAEADRTGDRTKVAQYHRNKRAQK